MVEPRWQDDVGVGTAESIHIAIWAGEPMRSVKRVTPNDSASLIELGDRILAFQEEYGNTATPFEWKFTRDDLAGLLRRLAARPKAA